MVLRWQETAWTKAERLLRGPLANVLVNGGNGEGDEAGDRQGGSCGYKEFEFCPKQDGKLLKGLEMGEVTEKIHVVERSPRQAYEDWLEESEVRERRPGLGKRGGEE